MALQDLTFDEAELGSSSGPERLERYKGTDGCVDRIAIVFFRVGSDGKADLGAAEKSEEFRFVSFSHAQVDARILVQKAFAELGNQKR